MIAPIQKWFTAGSRGKETCGPAFTSKNTCWADAENTQNIRKERRLLFSIVLHYKNYYLSNKRRYLIIF